MHVYVIVAITVSGDLGVDCEDIRLCMEGSTSVLIDLVQH